MLELGGFAVTCCFSVVETILPPAARVQGPVLQCSETTRGREGKSQLQDKYCFKGERKRKERSEADR